MAWDWDVPVNDGCTMWFDVWRGISLRHCCDVHDQAYASSTSLLVWVRSNLELVQCGIAAGAWDWALLAGIGVSSPIALILFIRGKKQNVGTD